ncbi:hypothetical protein ACOSP7_013677 [Xanthoceras sorbifolium]
MLKEKVSDKFRNHISFIFLIIKFISVLRKTRQSQNGRYSSMTLDKQEPELNQKEVVIAKDLSHLILQLIMASPLSIVHDHMLLNYALSKKNETCFINKKKN